MIVAKKELISQTKLIMSWLLQKRSVDEGFRRRFNVDDSGRILEIKYYGSSTLSHLFELEDEYMIPENEKILYIVFFS